MTTANIEKTCVSDRPIKANDDALGNDKYALGLLRFIKSAETPVTIGIQGGWGSGKTSLINILQHHLDTGGDTLSVFINAWEHSLFHSEQDKSSVAISLLSGVVESICSSIESKSVLPSPDGSPRIAEAVKVEALREDSSLQKIGKVAVGLVALSARIGAKFVADVEVPASGSDKGSDARPSGAKIIRELRKDLAHAVETVVTKTPYRRFVCFIDDLDRVHPRTSIEILDVLKNVFDISGCVFVLAIDYDVVVKGLEDKFGKKSAENEREYRQYFDKIIQVPFAMPVGAYSDKMEKFLASQFASLNLGSNNIKRMAEVALLATDGIPRGVKRVVNTLSLLMRIRELSEDNKTEAAIPLDQLEILFTVVALQINFPEIYRRLAESPEFKEWEIEPLRSRWDLYKCANECEYIDEDGNFLGDLLQEDYGNAFDEEWEHVVFLLCQGSTWLRNKAVHVSRLLNLLAEIQAGCDGAQGVAYLQEALDSVSVTSIESSETVREEGKKPKDDRITDFCRQVHQALEKQLRKDGYTITSLDKKNWAKKDGRGQKRTYFVSIMQIEGFTSWELIWNDDLVSSICIKPPHGRTTPFREFFSARVSELGKDIQQKGQDVYEISHPVIRSVEDMTNELATQTAYSVSEVFLDFKRIIDGFR